MAELSDRVKQPRKKAEKAVKEEKEEVKAEVKAEEPEKKKEVKERKKKEVEMPKPKWQDLYFHLSHAGVCFLRSLAQRNDLPEDAKHILHGVIALGDACDGCVVEENKLTAEIALFWADALKEWAEKK